VLRCRSTVGLVRNMPTAWMQRMRCLLDSRRIQQLQLGFNGVDDQWESDDVECTFSEMVALAGNYMPTLTKAMMSFHKVERRLTRSDP
jgi:hypothetical protein